LSRINLCPARGDSVYNVPKDSRTAKAHRVKGCCMEYTKCQVALRRLERKARLYVGVPKKMEEGERFPVLYMHDGHNVFPMRTLLAVFLGVSFKPIATFQTYPESSWWDWNAPRGANGLTNTPAFPSTFRVWTLSIQNPWGETETSISKRSFRRSNR